MMRRGVPSGLALTVLLGSLAALPPLSIDLSLPALPAIEHTLPATAGAAALTLSLFMAGFALSQLIFGPLSDRFGRRPVLLAACTLYALAGFACAFAPSAPALVAGRLFEGAGAGGASVLVLATVRDLFEGAAARARLSAISLVNGVAPIVSPMLGSLLLPLLGWRGLFGVLAAAGVALLATVTLALGETIARTDSAAIRPSGLLRNYGRALASPATFDFALTNGCAFGCMFAWVAGSPLLLIGTLGLPARSFSLLFACTAGAIMAGAALSGALARRHVAAAVPLRTGVLLAAASALALLALLGAGVLRLEILMPLLVANTFCFGLIAPNAAHAAIEPMPEIAGVAAAVFGASQMVGGALSSAIVGAAYATLGPAAIAATMAAFAVLALLLYFGRAQRAFRPQPAAAQ